MNEQEVNFLLSKIEEIEQKIQNIQLMYRPPEREGYVKITEYLDEVDSRLRELENGK
jgi:hypothetical protein